MRLPTFIIVFVLAVIVLYVGIVSLMPKYEWAFDHYPHDGLAFWLSLHGWMVAMPVAGILALGIAVANDAVYRRKNH